MDLHDLFVSSALEHGIPLAGSVDIELAQSDPNHSFHDQIQKYRDWLKLGYSGAMEYLSRGLEKRENPALLFPSAQSVLTVAVPYSSKSTEFETSHNGPKYARYLRGPDYHVEISARLEKIMESVSQKWEGEKLSWKVCVDTSAVLERTWAMLSGLGWIGKNTVLMHPQWGSYLFLGEVLVNARTHRAPVPMKSYCGNCQRCLDACPTQAFPKPQTLDSRKCISYWTLEKRGELDLSPLQKKQIGSWIAGCDICQEVCPFNFKRARTERTLPDPPSDLGAIQLRDWKDLLTESPDEYRIRVSRSALKRVKPGQFSRNLALSLHNALKQAREKKDSAWIETLRPFIIQRHFSEEDEHAKKMWEECISTLDS